MKLSYLIQLAAQRAAALDDDVTAAFKVANQSEPLAAILLMDLLGDVRKIRSRLVEIEGAVKTTED